LVTLRQDPPEGVRIVVDEEDLTNIEGWVQGPGKCSRLMLIGNGFHSSSWYICREVSETCEKPTRNWGQLSEMLDSL
jgi:hypothetical protein